jgi:hypothetical protein
MAITLLQSNSINGSSTGSFTADVPAGSLLIAGKRAGTGGAFSDPVNGSWTQAIATPFGPSGVWYVKNCLFTPASTVITTASGNAEWIIAAFSGIDHINALDQTNTNSGSTAAYNSGSVTPSIATPVELLLTNIANNFAGSLTDTPGAGWVDIAGGSGGNEFLAFKIVTASAPNSNAGTFNSATSWGAVIASFAAAAVATPVFSPVSGSYGSVQLVTISSTDSGLPGFAIFYTTDGSVPTTSSTPYTGPISVSSSQTIRALASATNQNNSAVGSATYTISAGGAYSVPDSRAITATTPNSSRTVQGTKIYDVPKVDSRAAGAPVDCRIAPNIPVDSRVSPNIPQNSRTPGTFGPGE